MVQEPRRAYRAKRQSNFERRGVNVRKRTNGNEDGCAVLEIATAIKSGPLRCKSLAAVPRLPLQKLNPLSG